MTEQQNQEFYLKRTYEWLMKQQRSLGLINSTENDREADFLNPAQVQAKLDEIERLRDEKRMAYMDPSKTDKFMKEMFIFEERTDIVGVAPARDRIRQYKTKNIINKRFAPETALPGQRRSMTGTQSAADFKQMPSSAKMASRKMLRPTTAAFSHFGQSEAPTAVTEQSAT